MNLIKFTNEKTQNSVKPKLKIYTIPSLSKSKSNMHIELKSDKNSDMLKVASEEYLATPYWKL